MQSQSDFKLCASSTDVVKRFAVIKSVVIKRVHCISLSLLGGDIDYVLLSKISVSKYTTKIKIPSAQKPGKYWNESPGKM